MTDLPHLYTSDIQFQETIVDAADTQFDIQRMGQNCNYLIDNVAPTVAALNAIAAKIARCTPFNASGFKPNGDSLLFDNSGLPIYLILALVQPGQTNTAQSSATGGFFMTFVQGPPIPTLGIGNAPTFDPNVGYNFGGGAWKIFINQPSYSQAFIHLAGAGTFNIYGIAIHA